LEVQKILISKIFFSRSIKTEQRALNTVKKVLYNSKALQNFRIYADNYQAESYVRSKNVVDHVILRILEGCKNHSALTCVDFSLGE